MENTMTVNKEQNGKVLQLLLDMPLNKRPAYSDGYFYSTFDQSEFMDRIQAFGEDRTDFVTRVKELVFMPMPITDEELCEITPPGTELYEAMADSMKNGTKLYLQIDGSVYPLRDTACISLYQRVGIFGPALETLPRDVLARHLNEYANYSQSEGRVIVNNRKLEAMLGKDYRLIPAEEIMATAAAFFDDSDAIFKSGYFGHTGADAEWKTGRITIDIPIDTGLNAVEFEQTVRVSTSDCGTRSVTIAPQMRDTGNRYGLNYCLPLQMDHKGEASIERMGELLNLVENHFSKAADTINDMAETNLMYPANVLLSLMKWLKIPAKYGTEVFERRKVMWRSGDHSAYEVYGSLSEVLDYMMAEEKSRRHLAEYQEKFSRGLKFNYRQYDLPGDYGYNDRLIGAKGA